MHLHVTKPLNRGLIGVCLILASLIGSVRQARAQGDLQIGYSGGCHESIGVTTVARSAVLALLPADYGARYGFGGFGSMPGPGEAQIIIRSVVCGNASLGSLALGSVVNSQMGVISARRDAEDFDAIAGNGIDNFQLEFATTSVEIAAAMGAFGMPARLDTDLSLVFSGDNVNNDSSPLFTATGSHAGPSVSWPGGFIAHWWGPNAAGDIRSRQVIQAIDFKFGGGLTISAGSTGPLLGLVGAAPLQAQVPLGGSFADGPVTLSIPAAPGPLPFAGAAAALAWSRSLRRRLRL
ncbi:MAG: hypothetical protein ACKO6F_02860 [Cyanobium sp.]